mgnify:CR=1 FL=1
MVNKIIKGGLVALALAGAIGFFSWTGNVQRAREAKEQAEFSALYHATETVQEIAGEDGASGERGQELLDSLGIKYTLKENEIVKLEAGSKSAYVNIKQPSKEYAETRGFADKAILDKYISSHQKNLIPIE